LIHQTLCEMIPATLRNAVWNRYIGADKANAACWCCHLQNVDRANFECGHIVSKFQGGTVDIDNLRPICALCNRSMGSQNMIEFINQYLTSHNANSQSGIPIHLIHELHNRPVTLTTNTIVSSTDSVSSELKGWVLCWILHCHLFDGQFTHFPPKDDLALYLRFLMDHYRLDNDMLHLIHSTFLPIKNSNNQDILLSQEECQNIAAICRIIFTESKQNGMNDNYNVQRTFDFIIQTISHHIINRIKLSSNEMINFSWNDLQLNYLLWYLHKRAGIENWTIWLPNPLQEIKRLLSDESSLKTLTIPYFAIIMLHDTRFSCSKWHRADYVQYFKQHSHDLILRSPSNDPINIHITMSSNQVKSLQNQYQDYIKTYDDYWKVTSKINIFVIDNFRIIYS
jgi:hypothetical protein